MKSRSFFRTLTFAIGLLFFASCSVSHKNTDLLEYGYKGAVKSVKSTMYYDLVQEDDEWVIDDTKIGQIRTVTYNEEGNIVKAITTYPEYPNDVETTYFQFEDGRKSGFYKIDADNDTIEKAVYTWISDTEYHYTSKLLITGRRIKSTSKLNENHRDLSGGYTFQDGDSTLYANSYINTLADNNLITEIIFTNEVTKERNILKMTYSNFDKMKNPLKLEMVDEKTGLLDNLSVREFNYFE